MKYTVEKHYPYSLGLSAVFRQWRAESHCSRLHGYALAFTFEFESENLDDRNWVIDFGALGPIKDHLIARYDHRLIVADDDPFRDTLCNLGRLGLARITSMRFVGCEGFALDALQFTHRLLVDSADSPHDPFRCRDRLMRVKSVTCHEHEGNSATVHNVRP